MSKSVICPATIYIILQCDFDYVTTYSVPGVTLLLYVFGFICSYIAFLNN